MGKRRGEDAGGGRLDPLDIASLSPASWGAQSPGSGTIELVL